MGVTAAFSFYPGKNLGALGDGGAVTTNSAELAERLRLLRNHGQADKYTHALIGYCDRLHNLQAALLSVKLDSPGRLERGAASGRRSATTVLAQRTYAAVRPIRMSDDATPVFHLYVVRLLGSDAAFRDSVRERLAAAGIESGIHYPVPLHLQPAYAQLGYRAGDFPVAERLAAEILSLPMFPEITSEQQDHVASTLAAALR